MLRLDAGDYQDLRLAVVMNGGVSLAVWIGGVAMELRQLEKPSGAYVELLEFMATRVQADVISGTSAGGINGAFMAAARAYNSDLGPLRELWINRGAIENLLYPANAKAPRALLSGQYFLDELRKAFRMLTRGKPTNPAEVPIDLTLTATLLHGSPNTLVDDFGIAITDSNHRASFNFRRDGTGDDFVGNAVGDQLALASRSTASFPLAFEPQFADCIESAQKRRITSFSAARYLLDGGILENKPLDHAIKGIRRQRLHGNVRRVLCYIVPSPEQPASAAADLKDKAPTIMEVGTASLAGIPLAQSISAQLSQVAHHNRLVREVRSTRQAIARLGWDQVEVIAQQIFEGYRERRVEGLGNYIADEIANGNAESGEGYTMGRRRKEWIAGLFLKELRANQKLPWVPDVRPSAGQNVPKRDTWNWGLFTSENIANVVIAVLRQGIRRLPLHTRPDEAEHTAKLDLREKLGQACDLYLQLMKAREDSHSTWRERGKNLQFETQSGQVWVKQCIEEVFASAVAQQSARDAGEKAFALAGLLADGYDSLRIAAACGDATAKDDFLDLCNLFVSDKALTTEQVLERLLNLEVVQFGFGISSVVRDLADQILELAEISADNSAETSLGLSNGKRPLGSQLASFGGFYKRSWRAYDWALGRLHGVERMARIILDPQRLIMLAQANCAANPAEFAINELSRIAVPPSGPDHDACKERWARSLKDVTAEIESAFQDSSVPEQLPITAKAILYRFELMILREELPNVAFAVQQDIGDGHASRLGQQFLESVGPTQGRTLADLTLSSGEAIERLWISCRLGEETFEEEMETDRFIGTLTQAAVVGTTVLRAKESGLGAARRIFTAIHWPTKLSYWFWHSLVEASKATIAAFVFVISASLSVAAVPIFVKNATIPWKWRVGGLLVVLIAVLMLLLLSPVRRMASSLLKRMRDLWSKLTGA